jgi:hypothetical protein
MGLPLGGLCFCKKKKKKNCVLYYFNNEFTNIISKIANKTNTNANSFVILSELFVILLVLFLNSLLK